MSGSYSWAVINAGGGSTCGVTTTGVGYCWGQNSFGEIGSAGGSQNVPTAVTGSYTWASISAGSGVSCGYTTSNVGYCWGAGGLGAVGNGGSSNYTAPQAVSGGYAFASIGPGGGGACGLTTGGMPYCWGWDVYGTLGDGRNTNQNTPQGVIGFSALQNNTTTSVTIDASFSLTITNKSSACNGESNFVSGAGSATAVALGHLAAGSNVSGGQTLTITTNAGGGFVVYVRGNQTSQNLRSGSYNWTDVAGSYASPAALGSGERFGYTYKDSTSSTSVSNPSSASFIALTGTSRAVMGSTSSAGCSGCVSFDAQTSSSTPSGGYAATVIYTAIPTF